MSLFVFAPSNAQTTRFTSAAKTVAGAGQAAIFTVTGRIKLLSLSGYISTVIGAAATTLKITANPTVGADTDISAATAITSRAAGGMIGLTGVPTDQLQLGTAEGAAPVETNNMVIAAGSIDQVTTGGTTGDITWTIYYQPLTDGAVVS